MARNPTCVANWPECWDGGYDPRCCRFPKSCSCGGDVGSRMEVRDLISLTIKRNDDGTHGLEETHETKGHKIRVLVPSIEHLQLHLGPILGDDGTKIVGYALIIAGNATPFNAEGHMLNWTVENEN